MQIRKIRKVITTTLVVILTVSMYTLPEAISLAFAFSATISPTQVYVNQLNAYLITITNTGNKNLGSARVTIPAEFTITSSITILSPPSGWTYTLSSAHINLTGINPGAVIAPGGTLTFVFNSASPNTPRLANWTVNATSNTNFGGTTLQIEGAQPAVTVNPQPPFIPPTITASTNTINQGQTSFLSQLVEPSGGIPPYRYQWLQSFNEAPFSSISGANQPVYSFQTTAQTTIGTWAFRINVTDSSAIPTTVTSNTVNIVINSALTSPTVIAVPNIVYQSQTSTLTSSPVTSGTAPYTFRWLQKAPGTDYVTVGSNSTSYIFPGSTTLGTWNFLLQITDGTGANVNSSETQVVVSSTPAFTIAVTQAPHGTINPGTTSVTYGGSQAFTISPGAGYYVADVLVDGISVGPVTSYLFTNVVTDRSLTAVFNSFDYALMVSVVGNGSVAKNPEQATYHYGDVVLLTATPGDGWSFSGWSGDFSSLANPVSIIINGSVSVTATFAQSSSYVLTITTIGSGSVTKTPDQPSYSQGDMVMLMATPAAGWSFSGWSGDFSSSANPISIAINRTTSVTATFIRTTYALTISTVGNGSVARNNTGPYYLGDIVRLTAHPSVGWSFNVWGGALSGSNNPIDLLITGDLYVIAAFTQNAYSLTISTVGSGSITLNPSQSSYQYGAVVQLTAIPASGWRFGGWNGSLTGALNPFSIMITGNSAVTAVFLLSQYTITASATEGGSINPSGITIVGFGGNQTYTITASNGYHIVDVSVNGTSVGPVSSYTISNVTGDTTITASFATTTLTISSSTEGNGSINPTGTIVVDYGSNHSFTIMPDTGYHVADVFVDGISVGAVTFYTFARVTRNHTIFVLFKINTYLIEASGGPHGSISPAGTVVAHWNATQGYAITPDEGCHIVNVVVDGVSVGPVSFYVFSRITSNHNITASFAKNIYFINVTSPRGSPTPSAQVIRGGNLTVSVTEIEGSAAHRWICTGYTIDGATLVPGSSYNFANIQANHTIMFIWQEQYYLAISTPIGAATGTGWYNASTTATVSISSDTFASDNGTRRVFAGWSGDASGTGLTSNPIAMTGPKTVIANWKTQYYLTVVSDIGSGKGQGWYDAGSTVTFSVETPVSGGAGIRFVFKSWTGTDGAYTGTAATSTVTMNQAVTQKATWMRQYEVTYEVMGTALHMSLPAPEWVNQGAPHTATFPPLVFNSAGNARSVFISDNRTNVITAPTTITGTYQTQYLVTFSQNGLRSSASGIVAILQGNDKTFTEFPIEVWIDAGEKVTFSYAETVESPEGGEHFVLRMVNFSSPLAINEPMVIEAQYEPQITSGLNTILLSAIAFSILPLASIPVFAFRRRKRKITPIAIGGGSISPGTIQKIKRGGDSTVFIITANPGYRIADVVIDNTTHLGAVRTYKFFNVNENHTISAIFYEN